MNIYQHQQDGIDFILKNNGVGALYFDCGLGKTVTTIIIKKKLGGRCLVFCPLTLITNAWIEDIQKFAPELTYQNLHDDFKKIRQVDFYLANYEMAVRKEKLETIMQCQPDMIVLDESQKCKCNTAQTTKNLLSIRNFAKYKILLSGTPAPNDESEYWAQMMFLNDSIFPTSFYQFRNHYFHLKRGKQVVEIPNGSFITKDMSRKMFSQGFKYDILPEKRTALLERMRPYVMFKKLHECVDLPESTEIIRKFALPPDQYKTYKAMRDDLVAEIKGQYIAAPLALTKISKLRQISSGFLIDSEGKCVDMEKNAKLDELKELLAEIGTEQVIIWTWFVHEAAMIKAILGDKARIINGTTDENDKNDFIGQFKNGSVQYLIANPQSVAHGITLTNAHYAIYYSLSYSHEQHYQSVHRIMRISQKNQCFYYYLLADKTIDEIIFDVLKRKAGEEEIIKEMLR